jgi:hypothetical protein
MKVSKPCLFNSYGEGWRLSLLLSPDSVKDARRLVDDLKDKDLDCDIKVHREKRSLTANAYAWQLMSQIGKAVSPPIPNEDVYEIMLRRYAPVTLVSVLKGVNLADYIDHAELYSEGAETNEWRVYKGSSQYDSKEMSVFIEGVKSEAESLGIETLTPTELEALCTNQPKNATSH